MGIWLGSAEEGRGRGGGSGERGRGCSLQAGIRMGAWRREWGARHFAYVDLPGPMTCSSFKLSSSRRAVQTIFELTMFTARCSQHSRSVPAHLYLASQVHGHTVFHSFISAFVFSDMVSRSRKNNTRSGQYSHKYDVNRVDSAYTYTSGVVCVS